MDQDYPISGLIGEYYVSNWGRIYCKSRNVMYPSIPYAKSNRYLHATFYTLFGKYVENSHRIIMRVLFPNPNYKNLVINHIDGIKCHNWYWNLEWCTVEENNIHAYNTGLIPLGDKVKQASISNNDADMLASLINQGYKVSDIVRMTRDILPEGTHIAQICNDMIFNNRWKSITKKYNFEQNRYKKR